MRESIMESLQDLCCSAVCFNPEKILRGGINDLNIPCLEQVVKKLSMNDLLKYQQDLRQRGIDTKAAIYSCQWKLLMPVMDSHMASTVCPHLLDLSPRNGYNWGLSCALSRIIRKIIEHLQDSLPLGNKVFDAGTQTSVVEAHDCVMQLFCPPGCSENDLTRRKMVLPEDALWNFLTIAAKNILSLSIDLKFCKFFSNLHLKPVLDIFQETLHILSVVLKSSRLVLDFVKTFKAQAKSLKHICLYVIRNNDLLYFDEILSVCSGVVGFHGTAGGKKDKVALHSMLASLEESSSGEMEDLKKLQKQLSEGESRKLDDCQHFKEARTEYKEANPDSDDVADVDSDVKSCSSYEFDLMDDAVLFGTASPPSSLDNYEGCTKADVKITNLVEISFCAAVLNHHLLHWLALTDLHLGVPDLQRFTVQGIICLLKRPQFTSFTLSSATVTRKDMEDIITAVASFRISHPLERLMFVSVSTAISNSCTEEELVDLLHSNDTSCSEDVLSNKYPKLSQCGRFKGTELLEIYCCGFDLWTEQLLIQFLSQNLALKTLCLGNNLMLSLGKSALRTLALNDLGQSLHRLILEEWPINGSNCSLLRDILRKMAPTLTSLSLKGCLVDKSLNVFSEIVMGISMCINLHTLDLSGNMFGNNAACFSGAFSKLTRLKELSLRGNKLPAHILMSIITELLNSSKQTGARMRVLDLRGNKFSENSQDSGNRSERTIKALQRSFVDKIIYDKEESGQRTQV